MKRYLSGFEFTKEFIESAILECLNHYTGNVIRWRRKDTSYFLAEYSISGGFTEKTNVHKVADHIRRYMSKHGFAAYEEQLIPYIAECLLEEIKSESIQLKPIEYQERYDSSSQKLRMIGLTSIKQQVYDYIVIKACKDMFMAKIGTYQCSSIEGRGQLYAKEYIEKIIQKKYKKARYVTKFDIKKCYPSIKHSVLFSFLERDIKNDSVLYVIKTLVKTYGDGIGLCIGTFLSQYLANYFLSYAYHYAAEQLFKIRKSRREKREKRVRLVNYEVFYMDDIALFGSSIKDLKKGTRMLIKYIKEKLELDIKHNQYQFIDLFKEKAFLDMVGYRFYCDHTVIRERIYKRICNDLKRIRKYKSHINIKICRAFMSRHGYVVHSDSESLKRKTKYDMCYNYANRRVKYEANSNLYGAAA